MVITDKRAKEQYINALKFRIRELSHIIAAQGEVCDNLRGEVNKFMDDGCKDFAPALNTVRMYRDLANDQAKLCDDLIDTLDRLERNGGCLGEKE